MTKMTSISKRLPWIRRGLWIGVGIALFFWIGYEDRSTFMPVFLGGILAVALTLHTAPDLLARASIPRWRGAAFVLLGLAGGALAMPLAALGMLVKLSLHAHVPPDFSAAQLLAVLERTPVWAAAGALVGSALALLDGRGSEG